LARVLEFQAEFLKYVDTSARQLRNELAAKKELTKEIEAQLKAVLVDFKAKGWRK
jgi:F0F1-type ATP synthase alpha subunit